jgi:hypothetical protein
MLAGFPGDVKKTGNVGFYLSGNGNGADEVSAPFS